MSRRAVAMLAAVVSALVLIELDRQQRIRLAFYEMELRAWELRQNVNTRRFLAGETDTPGLTPAPRWRG